MKLRTLQTIALATGVATVAISIPAMRLMQTPALDVAARPIVPWVPPKDEPQSINTAAASTLSAPAMLERPLFQPDRRPFQPPPPPQTATAPANIVVEPAPAPPAVAAPPPPPVQVAALNVTLKGVLMTDALDKAYLVSPDSPDGGWFTVGSEISGWKLVRIGKDAVTLASGEQKQVLQLYVDNPAMPVGNGAPAN